MTKLHKQERIADRFLYAPTLSKLYLELANVVPPDCVSSREIALKKRADKLALVLLMIAEGCADPRGFARETLTKAGIVSSSHEAVNASEETP
jgi:hypothetical protein